MATSSSSSSHLRGLMLLLLTSGFFIIGLLFDYMPMIVDNQIKRTVELATNEEIRTIWSKPPIDINQYYWLYAVENADQFMLGEKARIRRVGPYHFTSRIEKKIIELSVNKYRLFYNSTRHIKLNESARNPDFDTKLSFINPIYGSVLEGVREFAASADDPQMRALIYSSSMRLTEKYNESLIMNTTARIALLGRRVEFLERAKKLAETFGMDQKLPKTLPGGLFGYVAVVNGTWSGPYEIYTGYQASMPSLGDIISYQGKRRLTEFQGRCNRLQASAGEMRPMPIGNNQILEMFTPNFCRILHLQPTGVKKLREGQAISYVLAPEDFMGAESNPDNRCYCVNGSVDNYCSLNGVIELAPCNYYSPLIVTANNMQIDPRITNSIHDWDPELINSEMEMLPPIDNTTQMVILKRIGVPLRADITLVLFMKIIRDSRFKQTSAVPEVSYVPLMMVREQGVIPPALGQIIVNVESFLALTYHIKVVMYLSALVLLGWLTGHYYNKSTKDRVVPSDSNGQGGGRRRSSGDGGASVSPSERANSADSSKSQRPSRISQSSMDPNCDIPAVNPTTAATTRPSGGQQQQQRLVRRQVEPGAEVATAATIRAGDSGMMAPAATGHQLGSLQRTGSLSPAQYGTAAEAGNARASDSLAGKLDEQSLVAVMTGDAAKGDHQQQQQQPRKKQFDPDSSGDGATGPTEPSEAEVGHPQQADGGEFNDHEHDDDGGAETMGTSESTNRGHRNWFMKVCSNFVRMLNGIRSTINDAGQLDIIENDYQDKQLELLAGKIDNWQRYSDENGGGGGGGSVSANDESNDEQAAATTAPPSPMNNGGDDHDAGGGGGGITQGQETGQETGGRDAPEVTLDHGLDHEQPEANSAPLDGGQFRQQSHASPAAAAATAAASPIASSARASVIVNNSDSGQLVAGHSNDGAATVSVYDEIDRVGADAAATTTTRAQGSNGGQQQKQQVPAVEISSKPPHITADGPPDSIAVTANAAGLDASELAAGSTASSASAITQDTVRRADSVQSNLTIINRSDTSGDESICGGSSLAGDVGSGSGGGGGGGGGLDGDRDGAAEGGPDDDDDGGGGGGLSEEDKARALEQMEMALSKKGEPLFSSPSSPEQATSPAEAEVEAEAGTEVGEEDPLEDPLLLLQGGGKRKLGASPYESGYSDSGAATATSSEPAAAVATNATGNKTATTISNSFGLDGGPGEQMLQLGAIYGGGGGGGPKVAGPSPSPSVVMINSSTSMDSILDGSISFTSGSTNSFAAATATATASGGGARDDPATLMADPRRPHDVDDQGRAPAGHLGHNQSVGPNDQIDESSPAGAPAASAAAGVALGQSNKLAEAANGVATGGGNDDHDHQDDDDDDGGGGGDDDDEGAQKGRAAHLTIASSGVKDERRDSGVKLDSRGNGGPGNSSDTMATNKPPAVDGGGGGGGPNTIVLMRTKLEKNNSTNTNNGGGTADTTTTTRQQKTTSNGHSGKAGQDARFFVNPQSSRNRKMGALCVTRN